MQHSRRKGTCSNDQRRTPKSARVTPAKMNSVSYSHSHLANNKPPDVCTAVISRGFGLLNSYSQISNGG